VRCRNLKKKRLKIIRFLPKAYLFRLGILFSILVSLTTLGFAFLIRELVNGALEEQDSFDTYLYLVTGVIVLNLILSALRNFLLGIYTENASVFLRKRLLEQLVQTEFDASTFDWDNYLSQTESDLSNMKAFMAKTMPEVTRLLFNTIIAMILLFIFNWELMLIYVASMVILILIVKRLKKPLPQYKKDRQVFIDGTHAILHNELTIDTLVNKHHETVSKSYFTSKKIERQHTLLNLFTYLQSTIAYFITLIVGSYFVLEGQLTIGSLIAIFYLLHHVRFRELPNLATEGIGQIGSISRLMQTFEPKKENEVEFIE
jgi:ABC-type bacteriocin/lantibiotic exporter with double-glycine peptidase domain